MKKRPINNFQRSYVKSCYEKRVNISRLMSEEYWKKKREQSLNIHNNYLQDVCFAFDSQIRFVFGTQNPPVKCPNAQTKLSKISFLLSFPCLMISQRLQSWNDWQRYSNALDVFIMTIFRTSYQRYFRDPLDMSILSDVILFFSYFHMLVSWLLIFCKHYLIMNLAWRMVCIFIFQS